MRLGRLVAVKVFRQQAELTGNEARQEREIQVLARLQHPNIVSVFDAGTQGALSFVDALERGERYAYLFSHLGERAI